MGRASGACIWYKMVKNLPLAPQYVVESCTKSHHTLTYRMRSAQLTEMFNPATHNSEFLSSCSAAYYLLLVVVLGSAGVRLLATAGGHHACGGTTLDGGRIAGTTTRGGSIRYTDRQRFYREKIHGIGKGSKVGAVWSDDWKDERKKDRLSVFWRG